MAMYDISLLPNQHAVNSVASLYDTFYEEQLDLKKWLSLLKLTITESGFLIKQDYGKWFNLHGIDYLYIPKLFDHAPLNCICIFLSELFKLHEIEYLLNKRPLLAIESALKRLVTFKVDK